MIRERITVLTQNMGKKDIGVNTLLRGTGLSGLVPTMGSVLFNKSLEYERW